MYQKNLPSTFVKQLDDDALKLVAPVLVHVTEEVHSHLVGGDSIHKSAWPSSYIVDDDALAKGRLAKDIISEVRRWKSQKGMPLNKEIGKMTVFASTDLSDIVEDIKGTMNIRELHVTMESPSYTEVITGVSPDFSVMGPVFGKETKSVVSVLTDPEIAKRVLDEGEVDVDGIMLKREYISKVDRAFEENGKRVELIEHPDFVIEFD